MKKLIKLSILVLLLLSITFQSSISELGKIGFGLTGGYFNAFNNLNYVCSCDFKGHLDNFNKGSYFAGIVIDYPMITGISILAKLYYNRFDYNYLVEGTKYPSLVDDGKGGYITVYTQEGWEWEGYYSLMTLDLMPKVKISYLNLGLYGGISISYLINSNYNEVLRILSPLVWTPPQHPSDPPYDYNRKGYYFKEGEIPYKNNIRYALKAGLSYDLVLSKYTISPFVTIDLPLNSVVNGVNQGCTSEINANRTGYHWKITYYQAGIDLKYLF